MNEISDEKLTGQNLSDLCIYSYWGARVMHGGQQEIIYGKNKATSKAEIVLINPINDFREFITRLPRI